MRKTILTAAVFAALVAAVPAHGVQLVTPHGNVAQPYQTWASHARVPTPPGTVVVVGATCPSSAGVEGCYYRASRTIYVNPAARLGAGGPAERRRVFFHELYHDFDETGILTDADRARFERIMRLRGPWRTADHDTSPNESFADAGAACAQRVRVNVWTVPFETHYQPTVHQHRRVCALIRRASRS